MVKNFSLCFFNFNNDLESKLKRLLHFSDYLNKKQNMIKNKLKKENFKIKIINQIKLKKVNFIIKEF